MDRRERSGASEIPIKADSLLQLPGCGPVLAKKMAARFPAEAIEDVETVLMKSMKCAAAVIGALALVVSTSAQAHAASIVLTPSTAGVIGADLGPANCEPGCVETVFGLPSGSLAGALLYKSDLGGSDSGAFSASYSAAYFNTPNDPQDATVSWLEGSPAINCVSCYLAIKGGNQSFSYYMYDLALAQGSNVIWDGLMRIIMTGFWPQQGAISHVSIWGLSNGIVSPPVGTPGGGTPGGGTGAQQVPEPASLLLFAFGMGVTAFAIRRRRDA
jgi:hypothetical protein